MTVSGGVSIEAPSRQSGTQGTRGPLWPPGRTWTRPKAPFCLPDWQSWAHSASSGPREQFQAGILLPWLPTRLVVYIHKSTDWFYLNHSLLEILLSFCPKPVFLLWPDLETMGKRSHFSSGKHLNVPRAVSQWNKHSTHSRITSWMETLVTLCFPAIRVNNFIYWKRYFKVSLNLNDGNIPQLCVWDGISGLINFKEV